MEEHIETSSNDDQNHTASDPFPATCWTLVLDAGSSNEETRFAALSQICRIYWFPIYAFLRRKGSDHLDAEDLTQGFFGQLLRRGSLNELSDLQGNCKLRAYLLASVKNFATDEWLRKNRKKRGGLVAHLSIDSAAAESRYSGGLSHEDSPEKQFERHWARTVLSRCFDRLREQYGKQGKIEIYEALQPGLECGGADLPLGEIAERLGISVGNVRVSTHRMRQQYKIILRDEIAQTVSGKNEVESELRHLLLALTR